MRFESTAIDGAFLVLPERLEDERGFFARTFCEREFAEHGLATRMVQSSISFNREKGTLRGLHSHKPPHEEAKLVRCTKGAIYDVIVDLRVSSATYLKHVGVELTEGNHTALYIPEGVYHGFLTLTDNCEVLYQMSTFYVPGQLLGVRYDDPALKIDWPEEVKVISERDRSFPDYRPVRR